MTSLSLEAATRLAEAALAASGASAAVAARTAAALVHAEADGQPGHGLSRVPSYALQVRAGKVDGRAVPRLSRASPSLVRVDACFGFAYPAIDLAIDELLRMVPETAIAAAAIHRSHHFGQAGAHVERLAASGLVALLFGNTPQAMAFWGGSEARTGTNPIAFAAPLPGGRPPLVVDLALSVAARGKIVAARDAGRAIPAGWALDCNGNTTTDPAAALTGTLRPIGESKGAALALMVEVLAAALTGSSFGWEASSMFDDRGGPPDVGQLLLAIDPGPLSGGRYLSRMGTMLEAIAADPGTRLPGDRRLACREQAARHGLELPDALVAELQSLAAGIIPAVAAR